MISDRKLTSYRICNLLQFILCHLFNIHFIYAFIPIYVYTNASLKKKLILNFDPNLTKLSSFKFRRSWL